MLVVKEPVMLALAPELSLKKHVAFTTVEDDNEVMLNDLKKEFEEVPLVSAVIEPEVEVRFENTTSAPESGSVAVQLIVR